MASRYLVISSDCHAGLETPEYRAYLDPQYRDAFDASLVEREALLAAMREERGAILMGGDDEFQEEWFGHDEGGESLHEGGLRCGWDAPKRDKELDNDGVAGEVIFPGPDAATGTMGAPFGAGLVIGSELDPELLLAGARAYNRWCAELCSHSPERRKGLAVAPILGDIPGAVEEIRRAARVGPARRRAHPGAVGRLPVVRARRLRPGVGGVRGARAPGAHALRSGRAPGLRHRGRLLRHVRRRDPLVDGATAVVPPVRGCVRAFPALAVRGDRGRQFLGRRPALDARRHLQPQPRRGGRPRTASRTSR